MNLDEFKAHAWSGTMVPVYRELSSDTLTPVMAYLRLRRQDASTFLLESVEGGERIGRYSFLGRDPFLRVSAVGARVTIERPGEESRTVEGNFFRELEKALAPYEAVHVPGLPPLTGGAVGYIGYDAVRWVEEIPDRHARETDLPDADLRFYDSLVAFDHAKQRVVLIANAHVPEGMGRKELEGAYRDAEQRLDELQETLSRRGPEDDSMRRIDASPPASILDGMESNCTRAEFEDSVRKAREHIFAGDIFQVVLSQRFRRRITVDPFEVYRCLRALNPSPYLFYLEWPGSALLGSSPEVMVRVEDGLAMVRPIAGTRPRGATDDEDRRLEEELLADEKELAEHRMLVDLGRNDIGRVARFGTVNVSALEVIERYSHVMHIVSQVEGRLTEGRTAVQAFEASFPAGTVSGAPKIRAMEIIDELEPSRRGIYAGAVGYVDFAGNLDTCIAIRTLLFHEGVAFAQAGAGIVADSVPEREYRETIHKASALYEAVRRVEARGEGGRS